MSSGFEFSFLLAPRLIENLFLYLSLRWKTRFLSKTFDYVTKLYIVAKIYRFGGGLKEVRHT